MTNSPAITGTSDPKKCQTCKQRLNRGGGAEPPPHAHECVVDVLGWTYCSSTLVPLHGLNGRKIRGLLVTMIYWTNCTRAPMFIGRKVWVETFSGRSKEWTHHHSTVHIRLVGIVNIGTANKQNDKCSTAERRHFCRNHCTHQKRK